MFPTLKNQETELLSDIHRWDSEYRVARKNLQRQWKMDSLQCLMKKMQSTSFYRNTAIS